MLPIHDSKPQPIPVPTAQDPARRSVLKALALGTCAALVPVPDALASSEPGPRLSGGWLLRESDLAGRRR
ncbi:hypothetical protein [Vreelandella malpeensis]|uniref:Uncharacterized protein n=1 Tax=Vreelandella malpeensis TaxID=1172368 RepID=A0ABS8DRF0_9GAMM|nr:hypothetical protein [Halomonas malpeensis]MCB8888846.1 hypothetical protein [Halomonas malpeensis]